MLTFPGHPIGLAAPLKGVGVLRPSNLVVAAIGDSYTAASTGTTVNDFIQQDGRGCIPWARALIQQRAYVPGGAIKGVGGQSLVDILARISDVTAMSIAGPDGANVLPGTVIFGAGAVNDVAAGATLSTLITRLESCISAIRSVGQVAVLVGPTPQGSGTTMTAGQLAVLASWRDYLRTRARPAQGVLVADAWDDLATTPNGDVAAANMLYDNRHWTPAGAYKVGVRLAAEMNKLFSVARPLGTNLLSNSALAGSAGTMNGGITGQSATGWGASTTTLTGDQAIVASIVDMGGGEYAQQFHVSGTWAGSSSVSLTQTLSGWGTTYNIGDVMSVECQIEIDEVSPAPTYRLFGSAGLLYKNGGVAADPVINAALATPPGPVNLLCRMERYTHASDSTRNTANLTLTWSAGTIDAVVRFWRPKLVKH